MPLQAGDCEPEAGLSEREQRFREVLAFQEQGWSIRHIAQHLGLNWRTVKRYIAAGGLPKRGAPSIQRSSSVRPYQAYLEQRWAEGVPTATQLWQELVECGYAGSLSSVYRALKPLGPRAMPTGTTHPPSGTIRRALSPRQAMWALLREEKELTERDVTARATLRAAAPVIGQAADLGERFLQLIRQRDASALDPWLADAGASDVVELQRFATSLRQDYAAVRGPGASLVQRPVGGPDQPAEGNQACQLRSRQVRPATQTGARGGVSPCHQK